MAISPVVRGLNPPLFVREEKRDEGTFFVRVRTVVIRSLGRVSAVFFNLIERDLFGAFLHCIPKVVVDAMGRVIGERLIYPRIPSAVEEEETRFQLLALQGLKRDFSIIHQKVTIEKEVGESLTADCLVMEPKWKGVDSKIYNIIFFPGNCGKIELDPSSIAIARSLASNKRYLARVIVLSARNIRKGEEPYLEPLNETGKTHLKFLEKLKEQFEEFHLGVAFSLGGAIAAKVMDINPKIIGVWCLHASPSSFEKVKDGYWGGGFLHSICKASGWDTNPEKTLVEVSKNISGEKAPFVVTGLHDGDYYFSGEAGLCNSEQIKHLSEEGKVKLVKFKPSRGDTHPRAFHSRLLDGFDITNLIDYRTGKYIPLKGNEDCSVDLTKIEDSFIKVEDQNLPQALFRYAFSSSNAEE